VITAATALVASVVCALATTPAMSVDGQHLASDVAPVTTPGGGTYLPLRAVAEAAGVETTFDAKSGAITVRRGTESLVLHVGSTDARLDGKAITLASAPFTVAGRTMVAAATISRALGSNVRVDLAHGGVDVRTPGVMVAPVGDDDQP